MKTDTKFVDMKSCLRDYALSGWAVFPADPADKEPLYSKWRNLTPDSFTEPKYDMFNLDNGCIAVKLNPTDLIIDIDPRNFSKTIDGTPINSWKAFKKEYNFDGIDKDTFVVQTGSGGCHIYLSKPQDRAVRKTVKGYPGLDFLGGFENKHAYVIGAGSYHATGRQYKVIQGSVDTIKAAPLELLDILYRDHCATIVSDSIDFSDDEQNIDRFIELLTERALPAVEGQGGDLQTYKIACRGRDFNLSMNKTYELMTQHYNPKCLPPWEPDQLLDKVQNAYKYNTQQAGIKDPAYIFNSIEPNPAETIDPEMKRLLYGEMKMDVNAKGNALKTLRNAVITIYKYPERAIMDSIRYNAMSRNIEITGKLPWHWSRTASPFWTDDDTIQLKLALNTVLNIEFSTCLVGEAILMVSSVNTYHPLKDYLSHLIWDKVPRLSKWLTTYCGTPDSSYSEAIGRKTLIAAVARIYKPGIKFDHVLVLEGKQGIGKSMAVAALGGEWFGDIFIDPKSKDTVDALQGKWIIELSEMDSVRRTKELQALKAFITRTTDRVRPAYGRTTNDYPRQCIFIGTVNPDGVGYLADSTGNRRFWPVFCSQIDFSGIKRDRDQLFAEAAYYYQTGEEIYVVGMDMQKCVDKEAEDRVEQDPWVEIISTWDSGAGIMVDEVTSTHIFEHILGGVVKNITRWEQIRISKALQVLGWYKVRDGKRGNRFRRLRLDSGEQAVLE